MLILRSGQLDTEFAILMVAPELRLHRTGTKQNSADAIFMQVRHTGMHFRLNTMFSQLCTNAHSTNILVII